MKAEEIIELFRQFESIANEYEGVECWSAQVRDKQALRLSSGSSHVETQNFASDIGICIHFFNAVPTETQNFASLQVAGNTIHLIS